MPTTNIEIFMTGCAFFAGLVLGSIMGYLWHHNNPTPDVLRSIWTPIFLITVTGCSTIATLIFWSFFPRAS